MDSFHSTTDQLKSAEGRRESFGSQNSQTAKEYEITSTTVTEAFRKYTNLIQIH